MLFWQMHYCKLSSHVRLKQPSDGEHKPKKKSPPMWLDSASMLFFYVWRLCLGILLDFVINHQSSIINFIWFYRILFDFIGFYIQIYQTYIKHILKDIENALTYIKIHMKIYKYIYIYILKYMNIYENIWKYMNIYKYINSSWFLNEI